MKIKRTVTPKKKQANAINAGKSTGPRTERGKRASRMNALKLGFYSQQLPIQELDGEDAPERFGELLVAFDKHYTPIGPVETWLVEFMAQRVWRLARVPRAERGACLLTPWDASSWSTDDGPMHIVMTSLESVRRSIELLDAAALQIQRTGTLSEADYTSVSETLGTGLQSTDRLQADASIESMRPINNSFMQQVEAKRSSLQLRQSALDQKLSAGIENHMSRWALPSADDMDRILRYELTLMKQFERAQVMLLDCQRRRKGR